MSNSAIRATRRLVTVLVHLVIVVFSLGMFRGDFVRPCR